jgi:hypothetical protein
MSPSDPEQQACHVSVKKFRHTSVDLHERAIGLVAKQQTSFSSTITG